KREERDATPASATLGSGRPQKMRPAAPTTSEAPARLRVSVGHGWLPREPISGATVRIGMRSGVERVGKTSPSGLAVFDGLPAGDVHVAVTAPGYANSRDYWFSLKPMEDREIGERLDVAESIRGSVIDAADGRPVSGAVVTALEVGP